ncbi:zinc-dependent metalloprotease [Chryseobacterium artocarpi]|nr:zinc-dependent metalloprotease [Chryseobacterium artocarpi]
MKKNLLFMAGFIFALSVNAQNRGCGTYEKLEQFYKKNPETRLLAKDLNSFLTQKRSNSVSKRTVVTIPVVVHVLYKDATQNISEAQIQSQLTALNNDFRKTNSDFSTVVPPAFQGVASDMEIAFCLATKDPLGNVTSGVIRKSVSSSFNFDDDYYNGNVGGDNAWDTTKYLNIWVGAFTNQRLLGWAYPPEAAGYANDGLCITYRAFGTTGTVQAPYNKGRTATHEIGHYFGLNHIWGQSNDPTQCGTAINDDGCPDTPATMQPYFNTPVFPNNDPNYICTPTAVGAMFMNYMDYVNDAAMAMFTNDQKTIAQNTLAGPRASLLNSNSCAFLSVNEVEKTNSINLFPNPTTQYISIASPLTPIDEVEIFNAEGRLVKKTVIKNETDRIDVKDFANGVYYVRTYNGKDFVKSMKFIKK